MNIIFLARRFYPLIGGVEKHVMELSKELQKKGHKVIVITELQGQFATHEIMKNTGIEIYRISVGRDNFWKKFVIWKEMWKLQNVLQKATVVHCHDVFFWYLPFRFLYSQKPVYTTFHGYETYPVSTKAIIVRKFTEKLSWGNICIGDFIAKWYGTKPTDVSYGAVHNDINVNKSNKKENRESGIFIGRLDEQTGILMYLQAVKRIRKIYPRFRLSVIGDGKYKRILSKHALVKGFQNNPEKYFTNYHFAFVSRYLAILEAMAAKRLVFAVYDNPIKEDYLKMAPFAQYIVIVKNSKELSEKIIYYMMNRAEEEKLVGKAYSWSQKQTWERMAQKYLKLWRKNI